MNDHLYGDVWYSRLIRPGQMMYFDNGKVQIPLTFKHRHSNHNPIGSGYILTSVADYTYCDTCNKKFPSRKKLETMVGLKELTE